MKKTSAPATTDIAAFLAGNAAPKKKSSKKDNPELDFHSNDRVTCGDCGTVNDPTGGGWNCTNCDKPLSLTDRVYHAYQALQDAEANFNSLEAQLLEKVVPEYQEHATSGDFSKTFNVAGQETPGVQVSFKDAFKKIPLEKESALKAAMGDKYDTYFYQKREITVVDTSDAGVAILLAKLGPDDFRKFFKIEMSVGTKPDMDRKQFELPGAVRLAVQQYKPALKTRKED